MLENISLYYKQLSPSVRQVLVTAFFLVVSGAIFLFFFFSKSAELQAVQLQIKEVEKNVLNGKKLQVGCKLPTDDEKSVWYGVQEEYYEKIPPEKKVLELVREIAKTAQDCSIYDISFSMPKAPGDASGVTTHAAPAAVPAGMSDAIFDAPDPAFNQDTSGSLIKRNQFAIKTSFHCEYRDLAHFLEALSSLPRMLELAALTIERKVPLMGVEMTINAFYAEGMEDA